MSGFSCRTCPTRPTRRSSRSYAPCDADGHNSGLTVLRDDDSVESCEGFLLDCNLVAINGQRDATVLFLADRDFLLVAGHSV